MRLALASLAGSSVLAVLSAAPAGEGLVLVGDMALPRAVHGATALPSGDVLVTGGCTTAGCETPTATTELYLQAERRFVAAPSMRRPRVGHAAVALPRGSVLVVGGWSDDRPTATAERYVPGTGFVATGSMGARRGGFSATRLRDGRVLVVGGTDGVVTLRSAEVYDPATHRFTYAGRMAVPRAAHAAAALADGRVIVTGGSNERGVLASSEVWNPATRSFSPAARMTVPRHKHAAIRLQGGSVLVVGGSDERDFAGRYASAELYRGGRFRPAGRMSEARFKLPDALVGLPSGDVLVTGGGVHVERYEARSSTFRGRLRLGVPRYFSTGTLLADGSALVAGGYDRAIQPTARAWLYRRS